MEALLRLGAALTLTSCKLEQALNNTPKHNKNRTLMCDKKVGLETFRGIIADEDLFKVTKTICSRNA